MAFDRSQGKALIRKIDCDDGCDYVSDIHISLIAYIHEAQVQGRFEALYIRIICASILSRWKLHHVVKKLRVERDVYIFHSVINMSPDRLVPSSSIRDMFTSLQTE